MSILITVKATSITVSNGSLVMDLLVPLFNLLTFEDEYSEETKTLGFLYDEETDTIFLHKGVDLDYLLKLLGNDCEVRYDLYDECKDMEFEFEEVIAPRSDEQVDVINFICGQQDHAANIDASQIFLVKAPGFGKCEPYSSKIPSPTSETGFINMGDIKVGDYVFDRQGNPTKVLQIFEQGEQDVYELTLTDGRTARCTKDHMWTVLKRNGKLYNLTLEEIMNTYKSPCKHTSNRKPFKLNYKIPTCDSVDYPEKPVPIDPWVLGCFIGNGCCRERSLTISSGNDYVPSRIANLYGFDVRRNSQHNFSYTFRHKDGSVVTTSEFFKDIPEICNKYSHEKFIPDIYLYNTSDVRLRLLQGLMDTDGNIAECDGRFHTTYSSTSKKLLSQIVQILQSFGFSGTICADGRGYEKYRKGFCGCVLFKTPNAVKHRFFTIPYKKDIALKAQTVQQKNYYNGFIIKDIKKLDYKENCRCILVDNPEHLYLTDDYIVTHNTYCSGVGLCKYGAKTLIIMHRDQLRVQWMNSLYKMNGLNSSYVHEIDSSEELYEIATGEYKPNYDVYLMTHATFRAGLKRIGSMKLAMNIGKNLGIGLKIIDEAHLEFKDTILMDFIFNVKRNLYLTATDGRSSKDENSIFRHVFSSCVYYKPSAMLTDNRPKKWVNYYGVEVNTHLNKNIYKYRVVGSKSMTPASYGQWVIKRDKTLQHFKCCRDIVKLLFKEDQYAKLIIFMPLIDLCEECAYFLTMELQKDPEFPYDVDIRTINSKNSKKDNELAKHADIIVTTIGSCGTGTDIPGITGIISCSPFCSKIIASQVFGRIRYCGKICSYYDIWDSSVPMDKYWYQSRKRTLGHLALNVRELSWSDDTSNEQQT